MSIRVPTTRPDRPPRTYRSTVDANGDAVVEITPPGSYLWLVHQISVELASAPLGTRCILRVNGTYVATAVATGDALESSSPKTALRLWPGDTATVEWNGATPDDIATALVIYDEEAVG